jgi:uncharacterized membrane protein YidH (DUF202 family)
MPINDAHWFYLALVLLLVFAVAFLLLMVWG